MPMPRNETIALVRYALRNMKDPVEQIANYIADTLTAYELAQEVISESNADGEGDIVLTLRDGIMVELTR